MSQRPHLEKALPVMRVTPLQCTTNDGRTYTRNADIEDKISQALRRPPREWPTLAQQQGSDRLPSEVVVYLLTASKALGLDDVSGALVHQLGLRIARITRGFVFGFDKDTALEIQWDVERQAIDFILQQPPCSQGEYLQVAFRSKIEQLSLNATDKRKNRPLPLRRRPAVDAESGEEEENPTDLIPDEGPNPEELTAELQERARALVSLALAKAAVKNPLHLEAVVLRFSYDWPISHKDPNVPTLARRFGKSPRQIQNWITDALEAMRAAIGEKT